MVSTNLGDNSLVQADADVPGTISYCDRESERSSRSFACKLQRHDCLSPACKCAWPNNSGTSCENLSVTSSRGKTANKSVLVPSHSLHMQAQLQMYDCESDHSTTSDVIRNVPRDSMDTFPQALHSVRRQGMDREAMEEHSVWEIPIAPCPCLVSASASRQLMSLQATFAEHDGARSILAKAGHKTMSIHPFPQNKLRL